MRRTLVRPRRLTSAAALTGLVAGPLVASAALGATATVGSIFVPTQSCNGATMLQTASPGGGYAVPADGVITRWRYIADNSPSGESGEGGQPARVAFKVGRLVGNAYQVVATTAPSDVVPGGLLDHDTRIPVRAGDVLGIWGDGSFYTGGSCARTAAASYTVAMVAGDAAPGTPAPETGGGRQLDVDATYEPDADRDGYGDVTQDLCATDPTTQAACVVGAPETVIGDLTVVKRKVSITFGSGEPGRFECALDSPVFTPCASPLTVRPGLGKHTFAVRAYDVRGVVDATPAVGTFTVSKTSRLQPGTVQTKGKKGKKGAKGKKTDKGNTTGNTSGSKKGARK